MKSRYSAVELARILFAIGVIFLHYNATALQYVTSDSVNYIWLLAVNALSVGAVNFFVMISGYYLCSNDYRRVIKIIELILQAVLFNVAFFFGGVLLGQEDLTLADFVRRLVPENYFVILYCCLYIISPYINRLLRSLDDITVKKLIIVSFVLFSIISYLSDILVVLFGGRFLTLNTISGAGSSGGCSITSFILLYLIGAGIYMEVIKASRNRLIVILAISATMIFALSLIGGSNKEIVAWGYNNPFIVVFVATVILLLKESALHSKPINELAKASYTCYLFHGNFLAFLGIGWAAGQALPVMALHQLLVGAGLFLVSYLVYKVYNTCIGWLIKPLEAVAEHLSFIVFPKNHDR